MKMIGYRKENSTPQVKFNIAWHLKSPFPIQTSSYNSRMVWQRTFWYLHAHKTSKLKAFSSFLFTWKQVCFYRYDIGRIFILFNFQWLTWQRAAKESNYEVGVESISLFGCWCRYMSLLIVLSLKSYWKIAHASVCCVHNGKKLSSRLLCRQERFC